MRPLVTTILEEQKLHAIRQDNRIAKSEITVNLLSMTTPSDGVLRQWLRLDISIDGISPLVMESEVWTALLSLRRFEDDLNGVGRLQRSAGPFKKVVEVGSKGEFRRCGSTCTGAPIRAQHLLQISADASLNHAGW
ncbi:MAG: hypothetical protein A3D28_04845 [Omnitrophica bacterium RIFCSPHIGHO2_02_FULL_63_14]|nr:MAG: hypothetical protein A3D28_04845 [Omnitrophica bacterium RIFCSPHIGHO2_02_FULL_63_14]